MSVIEFLITVMYTNGRSYICSSAMHFSEIEGRPSILENRLIGAPLNFGKPSHMMIIRKFDYKRSSVLQIILKCTFPKLRGAPQFWKTSLWGADAWNFGPFWGVRTPKKSANFFCSSVKPIENKFCKKVGSKRPFQPSAVVRAIYTRLYGVATAN